MNLIDAEKVAEMLQVKPRTVKEKYRNRPDFPKPFRLSKRNLKWDSSEIESFIKGSR